MGEDELPDELRIGSLEQIKALSHPLRQRIYEEIALEAASTKQVAIKLGENPTRLYHHVNKLEEAGLIKLVETRQRRGATEKIYGAVARRLRLDPSALQAAGVTGTARNETQLGAIDHIFERTRSDVARLIAQQPETLDGEEDEEREEGLFAWVDVRCTEEELPEYRERLQSLLTQGGEDREDDAEDARSRYRLLIGFYPIPDGPES